MKRAKIQAIVNKGIPTDEEERDLIYVPFNKSIRQIIAKKRATEKSESSGIINTPNSLEFDSKDCSLPYKKNLTQENKIYAHNVQNNPPRKKSCINIKI